MGEPCLRRRYSTWTHCPCSTCRDEQRRLDVSYRSFGQGEIRRIREAGRAVLQGHLADGWSPHAIADAYDLSAMYVKNWRNRPGRLPGLKVARIVLAGPVRRPRRGLVAALGARRRLQGLACLGWPNGDLAGRGGITQSAISDIQSGRRRRVKAGVDQLVRQLYTLLENEPGPSPTAAGLAAGKGWAPPAAWDDIDCEQEDPKGLISFWDPGRIEE